MAISFTVSYTFSPSTTISSSQVNTNFSDEAAVWQGLEARTKSFAALQVDATPSFSSDVARKDYVDNYSAYRRPVLQYSSGTVVNIETGINGTSGSARILFSDGTMRTDSTTGRINCNLAQVAVLSGTAQSGLATGTVANNTWYAIYAVKVTDSSANFVTVASLVGPFQSQFATLNSSYGTGGWCYLGLIRYGDQSGTANVILKFTQCGNATVLQNTCAGNAVNSLGIRMATTASAANLTYTYSSGFTGATIPVFLTMGTYTGAVSANTGVSISTAAGVPISSSSATGAANLMRIPNVALADGLQTSPTASLAQDIYLAGWIDPVLGIGSNPVL